MPGLQNPKQNVPTTPTTDKDIKKKQREVRQKEQMVKNLVQKNQELDKELDKILSSDMKMRKNFPFICALRLDLISDKLQSINPRWSRELDAVADEVEKAEIKDEED